MNKAGWKYTAIVLGSVLFLSNTAQIYTRRGLESELTAAQKKLAASDRPVTHSDLARKGVVSTGAVKPLNAESWPELVTEERCMAGRRYAKINDVWQDLPGSC